MKPPSWRKYKREWIINNEYWTLKFVRKLDGDLLGLCDPSTQVMSVLIGQTKSDILATVVHELCHAIGFAWGIEELEKEKLVELLEGPVTKFALDNF